MGHFLKRLEEIGVLDSETDLDVHMIWDRVKAEERAYFTKLKILDETRYLKEMVAYQKSQGNFDTDVILTTSDNEQTLIESKDES
jgi:hypothetical protein